MKTVHNKAADTKCPYCGAAQKYPTHYEMEHGMLREYPTTYKCGTVTSPMWAPPIKGKTCQG
jgi:hypothetical protein